jgi:transcription antitermination factor NusG
VSGFVQFGDRLALLPDALVSEIKIRTGTHDLLEIKEGLEPGQTVEIVEGPFQGLEALVTRLIAARDRVEILIEWMGRSLRAEAAVGALLPLVNPRS